MKTIKRTSVVVLIMWSIAIMPAQAFETGGMEADVGIGTTGAEFNFAMQPDFMPNSMNLRVSYSFLNLENNTTETESVDVGSDASAEVTTNFDVKFLSFLVDWHPFNGGFHITGGLANNNSSLDVKASGNVKIADSNGSTSSVDGTINIDISLGRSIVPYLGFGYGYNLKADRGIRFNAGMGFYILGDADVDITVSDSVEASTLFDKTNTEKDIQDDLDSYLSVFPHIYFGVGYKFK